MLQMHGGQNDHGAENHTRDEERGREKLPMPLSLPKNRSTGNLAAARNSSTQDRSRARMSLDASAAAAAAADLEAIARSPIMTDHEHGLGLSGLRRIRQTRPPSRNPTLPGSRASSRSPSVAALSRSTSMSAMAASTGNLSLTGGPSNPSFSDDLSRFPSESLHSFSFANQSEDFLHNRQNALKRSVEFMKDHMGLPMNSSQAALASAQARVSGDVETQNMLDLLAQAQLIRAPNLPNPDNSYAPAPLTGPAEVQENVFDKNFDPRASSTDLISPRQTSPPPRRSRVETTRRSIPLEPAAHETTHVQDQSTTASASGGGTSGAKPVPVRPTLSLKRTMTDITAVSAQDKLIDTVSQPFLTGQPIYQEPLNSPSLAQLPSATATSFPTQLGPSVHGHTNRWVPAAQAIFTTEVKPPWTIIAANDLACLVFGVTKAEVRKMGILEVVQEERRSWLERKLLKQADDELNESQTPSGQTTPAASAASALLNGRSGITAQLLSKPNSRTQPRSYTQRRAQTVHSGDPSPPKTRGGGHNQTNSSRGVLLCGDVVPIQKRNGATGSASLWVKEKKVGLIWVLEEIHEDVAYITLDEDGIVQQVTGSTAPIWGFESIPTGFDIARLIPRIPRQGIDPNTGEIDFAQVSRRRYFTCPHSPQVNVPCTVEQTRGKLELRVSTFPHMAGIVVVEPETLKIRSSNAAFCGALFGFEKADGMSINALIPEFDNILGSLIEEDGIQLLDGMVVPEHRFRKASAFLALKEHRPDAASAFLHPAGLSAKHRDGSDLKVDVQMRVVKSEKKTVVMNETVFEGSDEDNATGDEAFEVTHSEIVYALWITYSRHLHGTQPHLGLETPTRAGALTPLHQPSPGQTPAHTPLEIASDDEGPRKNVLIAASSLSKHLKDAAMNAAAKITGQQPKPKPEEATPVPKVVEPPHKKTINDYVILEEMGQGAYGQVKLARHKQTGKKIVLKYVTKRRILVDTWTRDRKLGTVPLEVHVLEYLRKPELLHPNIVEMQGFFEDDVNYYIEMIPHGLPGMDLFDYIELRTNMDESECRSIFVQVANAIHHLHTKARVVHRDIKDENVILDGEGNIKLIDFGSAAYIKSGPFDVFVGTIDYAAPEVLAGKPYRGTEQDVWALGILLYTIIYKENPFYSIDEIMDRDLRIPYILSEESIDLIRCMLDRDVAKRYDINQVLEHPWCQAAVEE
ncbi:CAMK/CAMKL/PASK protein kinase [Fusarium odoratissimum NRRL 54006]|uniref:non-specific serine/threonine protein kinase n=1 Tax=Fusarium odoratissimum (strain NRRL 54006) TaxID=1089451 RepID=X0LIK8_FUSO5|nr:CAMK/CAMKL/PASK protein kinase [Fusarium odoratissimum NRRL 54006]EXM08480.1 CAMK/CAMKL/PASK protein kinase [Fusarium odoratissimum NRRL 54006]